jgi:hypothetical protein
MGHVLVGDCTGTNGGGVAMFWSVIVLGQTAVGWPCSGRWLYWDRRQWGGHVLVGDCTGTDGGGVAMFWSVVVLGQTAVGWPCSGR